MKNIFKMLEDNPPRAGDVLKSFLHHCGMSQYRLAKLSGVSEMCISEIVRGKRKFTPETCLRIAAVGGFQDNFWLEIQMKWELHEKKKAIKEELEKIKHR